TRRSRTRRRPSQMTTTHRISTTAAIILSVATLGAPAASARPVGLDAASAANGQSSTAVRPNPDQQTATGATANRIPAGYSRQDKSIVASASPSATSRIAHATALPAVVRLQAPASGFDWGDAGIGAAGGIA